MTATVRIRSGWAEQARLRAGGIAGVAEKLGVDQSTVSRQLAGKSEPGPRFIGAVLAKYCVPFDEAFEVVDVPAALAAEAEAVAR